MKNHDIGLAAIAQSAGRARGEARRTTKLAWADNSKPPLDFEGRYQKTSLTLDTGMWDCVLETAHVLTSTLGRLGAVA